MLDFLSRLCMAMGLPLGLPCFTWVPPKHVFWSLNWEPQLWRMPAWAMRIILAQGEEEKNRKDHSDIFRRG